MTTSVEQKKKIKLDKTAIVFPEDVDMIIKSRPNGKSPGADCITYEHLKPIADKISPVLASLYTGMLRNAYIPEKLKQGVNKES